MGILFGGSFRHTSDLQRRDNNIYETGFVFDYVAPISGARIRTIDKYTVAEGKDKRREETKKERRKQGGPRQRGRREKDLPWKTIDRRGNLRARFLLRPTGRCWKVFRGIAINGTGWNIRFNCIWDCKRRQRSAPSLPFNCLHRILRSGQPISTRGQRKREHSGRYTCQRSCPCQLPNVLVFSPPALHGQIERFFGIFWYYFNVLLSQIHDESRNGSTWNKLFAIGKTVWNKSCSCYNMRGKRFEAIPKPQNIFTLCTCIQKISHCAAFSRCIQLRMRFTYLPYALRQGRSATSSKQTQIRYFSRVFPTDPDLRAHAHVVRWSFRSEELTKTRISKFMQRKESVSFSCS